MAFIKRSDVKILGIVDPDKDINQEEVDSKLKKLKADSEQVSKNTNKKSKE